MKSFSPTKFIASLNSIQHGVSTCISQVKTSDWGIEEKVNKVKSFGSQKLNTTIYKSSVIIQNRTLLRVKMNYIKTILARGCAGQARVLGHSGDRAGGRHFPGGQWNGGEVT